MPPGLRWGGPSPKAVCRGLHAAPEAALPRTSPLRAPLADSLRSRVVQNCRTRFSQESEHPGS
jgi:hypothetical protein